MKVLSLLLICLIFFSCQRETSSLTGWQGGGSRGGSDSGVGNGSDSQTQNASNGSTNSSTSTSSESSQVIEGVYIKEHVPTKRMIPYSYVREADSRYSGSSNEALGESGKITAGELNDLSEWDFWTDIAEHQLQANQDRWQIHPSQRTSFLVQNDELTPINGASVRLYGHLGESKDTILLASSQTDNTGIAHVFGQYNLQQAPVTVTYASISYQGESEKINEVQSFDQGINAVTLDVPCNTSQEVDIVFVVDATGSMQDEIDFLKKDLLDIIETSAGSYQDIQLNLASLFYRCADNSYVTKHSDFSSDINKTIQFIQEQNADEGGNEVVPLALDEAINKLSWRESSQTKLLFIVLDEPPASTSEAQQAMRKAYADAAKKGIKIIPCVASGTGTSYDKSLEYLMRAAAIITNGTYVFFTNDSGIGGNHTLPIVKSFEVKKLNALLKRIISTNLQTASCKQDVNPIEAYEDDQSNIAVQTKEIVDSLLNQPLENLKIEALLPYTEFESVEEFNENRPIEEIDTVSLMHDFNREIVTMKVFPLPTIDQVTVKVSRTPDSYLLLDGHGRLLVRGQNISESTVSIDLSSFPRGNYFLKVMVGNTVLSSKIPKL